MVKKTLLATGLGLAFIGSAAHAQAPMSQDDMMKTITELKSRLEQLEARQAEMKTAVKETNEAVAEQGKKVEAANNKLTLGKGIDGLRLTGDLRARYETRQREMTDSSKQPMADGDRSRMRSRFRLGGIWENKAEGWEVGAGVATGSSNSGRSTNADWGSPTGFGHMDLWLDYAYAKHKFTMGETPSSFSLGQQKSPYITTLLNWDGDLRPLGFTLQYGDPLGKDYTGAFATAGAYMLEYRSGGAVVATTETQDSLDDNVNLFWLQGGYKLKGENVDWLGAVGYQAIPNTYRNSTLFANSANPNNAYPGVDTDYSYHVADLYLEAKTSAGGFTFKPYGQAIMNLGATGDRSQGLYGTANGDTEPSEENLGWTLGLDVSRGKWKAGYSYLFVGSDCCFGPLRDSDSGETAGLQDTDLQGHVLKLSYSVTKNFEVGATAMMLERINGGTNNPNGGSQYDYATMYQLDANYKF